MGEQLDPEALRAVMAEYFAVARQAIEQHGGTVEKFVGDAVLAVFGIPVVQEDDALRAVRAAAELRSGLDALGRELEDRQGVRLTVRTGVNTGAVVAGAARAGGSFATGDAVNTAARLEQAAQPGEVLLGASTYLLVRDAVDVEPVDLLALKGKAEPTPAYRLVSVRDVAAGRTRRLEAKLIGRERERRLLDDSLERVVATGRCQLVTVLGPAGIGKTRLIADFVGAVQPAVRVLHGRCLSYGRGITFWPIMTVLRAAAGLDGTEATADGRRMLADLLRGHDEAAAVVKWLAPLLDLGGDPGSVDETFWAIRMLLEHLAEERPLVLVVDDAHWAEPTLLDLLEHLVDWCRDVPLLLVCQARPELLETRPGWGGGGLNAATMQLEPLAETQTVEMVAGLLGPSVPARLAEDVARWAAGNPLFVEEVLAHLEDEGVLHREGDGWIVKRELDTVPVPPTISALLGARLERLPGPERAALQRASVVGLAVRVEDVQALTPEADREGVAAAVRSLARMDLLRRERGGGGSSYSFRHVLLREAAYDALPKGVRADLHECYADRLADHGEDAGAEVDAFIGHHLASAARLRRGLSRGDPRAEPLAERAAAALTAAAQRAWDGADTRAAKELLRQALELTPATVRARRERLALLADVHRHAWELTAAVEAATEAATLAALHGEETDQVTAEYLLLNLRIFRGTDVDLEHYAAVLDRAEEISRRTGDRRTVACVQMARLAPLLDAGRCAAQADICRQLLALGDAVPLPYRRVLRDILLNMLMWGPEPLTAGLRYAEQLLDSFGAVPQVRFSLDPCRAALLAQAGRGGEAALVCAEVQAQAEALQEPISRAADLLGHVPLCARDLAAAVELFAEGASFHLEAGGDGFASTLFGEAGCVQLELSGDDDTAARFLESAQRTAGAGDALTHGLCRTGAAVLAARAGRAEEAANLSRAALQILDSTDQSVARGDARRLLSEVSARRGDTEERRRLLLEALELYRSKGHVPFTALTERLLADPNWTG